MGSRMETVSLCTLRAGDEVFGFETHRMHEVLGARTMQAVPLAPEIVAGVVAYRGDVLMVLSFRTLLGLPTRGKVASVIVLEDEHAGELFGLAVDSVDDVVTVDASSFEENAANLAPRRKELFAGSYKVRGVPLIHLKPELLWPMRWMDLFDSEQGRTI